MVRHNLVGAFCRCRFYTEKQRDGKRLGDRAERRDPSRQDSRLAGVKPGMAVPPKDEERTFLQGLKPLSIQLYYVGAEAPTS